MAEHARPPLRLEQLFASVKIFGSPDGYDVVAIIAAPVAQGDDVMRSRLRERSSGTIAGCVRDQECHLWPAFAPHMPPGFHMIQASLSEFSAFERDSEGVLRTPRDLRFEIVDEFGQALRTELDFTWYAARTLPIPPRDNIIRVAGDIGPDGFLFGGAVWHSRLERLIERYIGRAPSTVERILDWGVGCGRIARHFLERGHSNIHGADIDSVNIQWLHDNFGWRQAVRVDFDPPLPYPADHFDVVYGHSVFTHLSQQDHFNWLAEIRRIVKPGGFAFLTVCCEPGVHVTRYDDATTNQEFLRHYQDVGFHDFEAQNVGVDAGREGYYRLVAQTQKFIVDNWSRYFSIRRIIPCYMEHQDLVILRKPSA